MKTIYKPFLLIAMLLFTVSMVSCEEEDESEELDIEFKTGSGYTFEDLTMAAGTEVLIGIEAGTERPSDPIIKFNISESVNDDPDNTVFSKDIETSEYEYDYSFTLEGSSGDTHEFTFTITNRDGFNKQANLMITVE